MQPGLSAGVVLILYQPSFFSFAFALFLPSLHHFSKWHSYGPGVSTVRCPFVGPALPLHFHPAWDDGSDSNYKSMLTLSAQSHLNLLRHWLSCSCSAGRKLPPVGERTSYFMQFKRGRREGGSLKSKNKNKKKSMFAAFREICHHR